MHATLCAVGLKLHKIYRKCPDPLLTTKFDRNRVSTGCYFLCCFVFSPHNMNLFVTESIVYYVVTHMQDFSSGIVIIFFEKLCQIVRCEGILN